MSFLAALIWFVAGLCVATWIRFSLTLERIAERLADEPSSRDGPFRDGKEPSEPQPTVETRRPDWQGPPETKRCRCPRCNRSERRR